MFQLCALLRMTVMVADKDVTKSDLEPYKSPEVVLERFRQQKEEKIVKKLKILRHSRLFANKHSGSTPEQKVESTGNRGKAPEIKVNGELVQGLDSTKKMDGNHGLSPCLDELQEDDLKSMESLISNSIEE